MPQELSTLSATASAPAGGMSRYQDDPTRGKSATVRPFAKPAIKRPEDDPVIAMARDRHKKGLQIEKQRRAMSGASGAVLHKILELKALEADLRAITEGVEDYQNQAGSPPQLTRAGCAHPPRCPRNGPCALAAKPPALRSLLRSPHSPHSCGRPTQNTRLCGASRTSHTPHKPHAPLLQVDMMNDRKRDLAKIAKSEQAFCDNFNKLIGPFEAKYEESKAHKDGQSGPLAVPQLTAQGEKNGRHGPSREAAPRDALPLGYKTGQLSSAPRASSAHAWRAWALQG